MRMDVCSSVPATSRAVSRIWKPVFETQMGPKSYLIETRHVLSLNNITSIYMIHIVFSSLSNNY